MLRLTICFTVYLLLSVSCCSREGEQELLPCRAWLIEQDVLSAICALQRGRNLMRFAGIDSGGSAIGNDSPLRHACHAMSASAGIPASCRRWITPRWSRVSVGHGIAESYA